MNYTDLRFRNQSKVRSGEIKAVEMAEAALAQIAAVDGVQGQLDYKVQDPAQDKKVHAFISLTSDLARSQAAEVDRKVAEGEDPGLLAGVPLSVKDIFCVEHTHTTAASRMLANFEPPTPRQR